MPFPGYRNPRIPLTGEIQYQGGPEGEVRITCRGWTFVLPGHVSVLEAVLFLNGQLNEVR